MHPATVSPFASFLSSVDATATPFAPFATCTPEAEVFAACVSPSAHVRDALHAGPSPPSARVVADGVPKQAACSIPPEMNGSVRLLLVLAPPGTSPAPRAATPGPVWSYWHSKREAVTLVRLAGRLAILRSEP